MANKIKNILTIDVEDWFQVKNFRDKISFKDWSECKSRIVNNTNKILKILKDNNAKATFFVLGWIAERFPLLIKRISKEGHEIATHGYAHIPVYEQTKKEFEEDLKKSLRILSGLTKQKIRGYRAPNLSINNKTGWVFEVLKRNKITYSSSTSFLKGNIIKNTSIIKELPVTFGGGYFRAVPYWFTKLIIKKKNMKGEPAVIYLHPWEFDTEQPRVKGVLLVKRFKHYVNLYTTEKKLRRMLKEFKFTKFGELK